MIGEAGTAEVRPEAGDAGAREDDGARQREAASFLSTHLLRELIAADARSEAAGDPLAERAEALLAAVLGGLELGEGAIVQADPASPAGLCLASRGVPDHARELLEARQPHLETLGGSLLKRALEERRVLLLDRTTRDPLMAALRDGNPDIECAVVVPLLDLSVPVGVLVLAARGRRLTPSFVRTLAVAFRLLGLLLAPGRGRPPVTAPRPDELAAPGDGERLLFEVEELTARLGEARAAARQMEERASAADAALRAEVESSRARTAELEAQLAGGGSARARELELESLCAEQTRAIEQGERRVAELEGELATLMERVAALTDGERLTANGATTWDEPALDDASDAFAEEEPAAATIELVEGEEEQLGEIAAAAVAALEEVGVADDADGTLDVPVDVVVEVAPVLAIEHGDEVHDGTVEVSIEAMGEHVDEPMAADVVALADEDPTPASVAVVDAPTQAVLLVDSRPSAQEHACAAATDVGAAFWCGDGALPATSGAIVAVNLLDEALARLVDSPDDVWSASRWIVYGAVADAELGFELGSCALIRRPIEPRQTLEQIRAKTGPKVNGILLVSAQLREVAGLRQALQEVDAASSVACDTRQALDLLEIIRRPDAIVIDLALPQGQGLGLAAQLRRQPETASLPLLLLLPGAVDPARLAAEAEKAQLLGPFVDEDVHRLVRATLAGRG